MQSTSLSICSEGKRPEVPEGEKDKIAKKGKKDENCKEIEMDKKFKEEARDKRYKKKRVLKRVWNIETERQKNLFYGA